MRQKTTKEPVRLRERLLSDGSKSLYLDVYIDGKRHYEFLKLYIVPGQTAADRSANKQTMQLANAIKAQRIVELHNGRYNMVASQNAVLFFDYFKLVAQSKKTNSSKAGWMCCYKYLTQYEQRDIKVTDITKQWVKGFRDFLDTKAIAWSADTRKKNYANRMLNDSSKNLYFQKLVACLNQAVKDDIIVQSPAKGIDGFKPQTNKRIYLTIDEVRLLAETECANPELKRAFLFSCLTGLRWSDVVKLRWEDVRCESGITRIVFNQQKTGGLEYLDISRQAAEMMGEAPDNSSGTVFIVGVAPTVANYNLRVWAANAGIKKHISFHTARHTFATMMLTVGTDIYTVSKLLGHRDIKTTQIYADIIDLKKRAAVDNIPPII